MSHCVAYPTITQAIACGNDAFQIIRAGEIVARKDEFGLHAWNVVGFANGVILGVPDDPHPFGAAENNELAATLTNLRGELGDNGAFAGAMPPLLTTLLGYLRLAIDVLLEWLGLNRGGTQVATP